METVEEDLTLATTETNPSKVGTAGPGTGLTGQTEKVYPGEILSNQSPDNQIKSHRSCCSD